MLLSRRYALTCSFYVPALVSLDSISLDADERSAKLSGFKPPEAPVELLSLPAVDDSPPPVADSASLESVPASVEGVAPECNLVVTSQDNLPSVHQTDQPLADNTPMVTFDVAVSAVTGISEPVLPDIQCVEVNGERVPVRERTAAEKKGSMFWLKMTLPAPYQHILLESQPTVWAAPLVFSELNLSCVEGSPSSAGGKLQLPCNKQTRNCLRDGFMTLRVMRKTPESPNDMTDAELEEVQVSDFALRIAVST
jgi:hypothetical protein